MTAMARSGEHDTGPGDQAVGERGAGEQGSGARASDDAPATKRLLTTVLIMETVVIWLAIPVAVAVEHASFGRVGVAGVALAVLAVVLAALARRRLRWTIVGGSVLQAVVIAVGVIVPVMYFLGAIFAAFWVIGLRLGHRLDVAS
jgi:Mg2+/Co2+ transporter CorB